MSVNASDRDVSAFCITVGGGNVYAKGHFQVAWDWVSHQGKKEKEISKAENTSVREKTREVVQGGQRVSPSPGQYFSYLAPLWSLVSGFFQVALTLCFKKRLGAKPLIRKSFFYSHANKTCFHKKCLTQSLRFESKSFRDLKMACS